MQRNDPTTSEMEKVFKSLQEFPTLPLLHELLHGQGPEFASYIGISLRMDTLLFGGSTVREDTFEDARLQTLTPTQKLDDSATNHVQTSWVVPEDDDATDAPWTRGCSRYCEFGPFKGHVTYHSTS
mmetsp:Transcript_36936/g.92821  ORF Transcript_36936/g.92821 Transcript_36936/m.92821 type:complete len:126 (-) Transcript_36936:261-638(-)